MKWFLIAILSVLSLNPERQDLIIEDFETWPLNRWSFEGNAFSPQKQDIMIVDSWGDRGYRGYSYVSSFINYDSGVGSMTSYEFEISRNYINFLLAGGNYENDTYAALVIDGKEVRKTSGLNNRRLEWNNWDVSEFKGKKARVRLVDTYRSYFGFICADHFVQSDQIYSVPSTTATIKLNKKYLFFPLNSEMPIVRVNIKKDGKIIQEFSMPLDGKNPKYWAPVCFPEYLGCELELETDSSEATIAGLSAIKQAGSKRAIENTLGEKFRPIYHFTSRVGHINDPNGLYYADGKWQLFYQHNPLGILGGNTSWGHAVSSDLTHWDEMDEILYPDEKGLIYSGSALKEDSQIRLFYTYGAGYTRLSEGKSHTQAMAVKDDSGEIWQKQAVLNVPRMAKDQRDPHVFWHNESGHWCMALFVFNHEYAILTSDDLINWTVSDRFYVEGGEECPDMFAMQPKEAGGKVKWIFMCANSTYIVGEFDGYRFYPQSKAKRLVDGNYYAVKSFVNGPDDRRILMAWMAGAEFKDCAFNNVLAYPRELSLYRSRDGLYELRSVPARELNRCTHIVVEGKNIIVKPEKQREWKTSSPAFRIKVEMKTPAKESFFLSLDGKEIVIPAGTSSFTALSDKNSIEIDFDGGAKACVYATGMRTGKSITRLYSKGVNVDIKHLIIEEIK